MSEIWITFDYVYYCFEVLHVYLRKLYIIQGQQSRKSQAGKTWARNVSDRYLEIRTLERH